MGTTQPFRGGTGGSLMRQRRTVTQVGMASQGPAFLCGLTLRIPLFLATGLTPASTATTSDHPSQVHWCLQVSSQLFSSAEPFGTWLASLGAWPSSSLQPLSLSLGFLQAKELGMRS